jgi:hypothetical protein
MLMKSTAGFGLKSAHFNSNRTHVPVQKGSCFVASARKNRLSRNIMKKVFFVTFQQKIVLRFFSQLRVSDLHVTYTLKNILLK